MNILNVKLKCVIHISISKMKCDFKKTITYIYKTYKTLTNKTKNPVNKFK